MNQYTIVIPVFGALEHVKRCLESVLKNTDLQKHMLLVIDDCSRESEVIRTLSAMLRDAVDCKANIKLAMHDRNVGFVRTANEGIKWALEHGTEPILLNSDTVVPPCWVERMDEAREAATARGVKVCSVSPLSNKCMQYSVPNQWDGELPAGLSVEDVDHIVLDTSTEAAPVVVTNVGFCMLLTREAIEAVGVFDTAWGKGYGEETDWCERAKYAGFSCVLADHVYVYHKHRASFGPNSQWKENAAVFEAKYPHFRAELERENLKHPLTAHRVRIANRLRPRVAGEKRIKVMFVCHNWGRLGGLEIFQSRLVDTLSDSCEVTVLHPRRGDMVESTTFVHEPNGVLRIVMSPRLTDRQIDLSIFPFQVEAPLVEDWFAQVVEAIAPDVVHFQHLGGWGTFRLPEIAAGFAKTVLSIHDEFYLCPSYLVAGWKCGRDRAADCKQCCDCVNEHMTVMVEGRHTEHLPVLLERREFEVGYMFDQIDRVMFPSDTMLKRYAEQLSRPFVPHWSVIPHGVPRVPRVETYRMAERTRVAWVGGVLPEKGWDAFADMARTLRTSPRFEFSVLGEWADFADRSGLQHVTFHGRYAPHELPQLLQSVDVAVPAVARKESFGLAVDECTANGVPVLLPEVDTIRERYGCGINGAWFKWGDTSSLIQALDELTHKRTRHVSPNVRSMRECATDYLRTYWELTQ